VSGSSVVLLPHTPASVAAARSHISAQLHEAGIVPPAIGDAALVVSELLSNAILHARPLPGARVQVAWLLREGTLEVAVSDGGSVTRPRPAPASTTATGGRGLAIVDCLARSWGVHTGQAWTTVWAVLPAPGGRRGQPPSE
jgi:anti-sigma regulatory factor (Ser/Thr protein kinase)